MIYMGTRFNKLKAASHDSTCSMKMLNRDLLCKVNAMLHRVYYRVRNYTQIAGEAPLENYAIIDGGPEVA